jgi:hypothetical protein
MPDAQSDRDFSWEFVTGAFIWSDELYRIYECSIAKRRCFYRILTIPAPGDAERQDSLMLASSGAGAHSPRGGRGARAPRESFRAATGKPRA